MASGVYLSRRELNLFITQCEEERRRERAVQANKNVDAEEAEGSSERDRRGDKI